MTLKKILPDNLSLRRESIRADKIRKDSEYKYKTLFSIENDALLLVDNESYRILEVNEAACKLYGYSEKEMLGLRNFELSAEPEKTKSMRENLKERVELRFHRKRDGTIFPVDISSSIFTLNGRSVILAAVRDITMHKRTEDLNLSRIHLMEFAENHSLDDLLEETLNCAEDLTESLIGFYHFVESNQHTLKLQNWSTRTKRDYCRAEGKGMSYDSSLAGVWADCLRERKPIIHNDYASLANKKGLPVGHSPVFREIVIPVIRGGKIMALMGIGNKATEYTQSDLELVTSIAELAWDITGRKRAEEVLLLSELRFKTMFNESPYGIALIDSLTGKVYSVNPMFAKIAGRKVEEMEVIDWMSITHPDDVQKDLDNMALLNSGKIDRFQMEKRYLRPDKTEVWISMTIAPIFVEDKSHPRHLCMIEDITERKKIELQIHQKNEELIMLNAEKDRFFSIIAHDLRTPFVGFLGLTEILSDGLLDMETKEIQQMAKLIRQSAVNVYNLLGNLLEWSRMQRGLIPFEPELFLLKEKIDESLLLLLNMADKKHIQINYHFPADLLVFADPNMISVIIRNLFSNAVKFTRAGGRVELSAKVVSPKLVKITVADNGIGMDKDILGNLFNLDIKTNRNGTEGEFSTGLGLILCKDFIEKHGGRLSVVSEKGKGSIFSFELPSTIDL
jgi:PAS domain S-box-containing protein